MQKIKAGDEVMVIAGKDKGRRGRVIRVVPDRDGVVVENANKVKKHKRANPQANDSGGIIEQEKPLHRSNVAIYNPSTGQPDRVGVRVGEDGRRVRFFKSDNTLID